MNEVFFSSPATRLILLRDAAPLALLQINADHRDKILKAPVAACLSLIPRKSGLYEQLPEPTILVQVPSFCTVSFLQPKKTVQNFIKVRFVQMWLDRLH